MKHEESMNNIVAVDWTEKVRQYKTVNKEQPHHLPQNQFSINNDIVENYNYNYKPMANTTHTAGTLSINTSTTPSW